ncbi:hypothetical protein GCM10010329_20030 [Streptomyces spiroverticillatus]|uniref:DUF11 domain-containing protein n=1 Tax=Streptomyces finlayi TaxID=67296 RepID=A0A918WUR9_9ACTN|nr:DUF11 domain-containing protein [Streptomyces finlayi]GGZ98511.1 hypothetical protein GCM10010329_20030 [Streptomyces spiroverticillatus]GHC83383.1 hypothetical protein GCM10010334_12470 [Streptomyces finlayi]
MGPLQACKGGRAIDAPGRGVLRLTDNTRGQRGFAMLDDAFGSGQGVTVEFDSYQYNGAQGGGADGISVFLIDGKASPKAPGKPGAGNGYIDLPGGYLGVTLDQWGNMASPEFGHRGGPGRTPNSVTVRGATSAGNPWISTKKLAKPLAADAAKSRGAALRKVRAELSPAGLFTVRVDFNDGQGFQKVVDKVDIDSVPGQPAMPHTMKIGFAAGTGSNAAIHEIGRVKVGTLGPDLSLHRTDDAAIAAGGEGEIHLRVDNAQPAGPSKRPVTVKQTIGDGLVPLSASGDGWDCELHGQEVECVRPGFGDDALPPGESFPVIDIPVKADPGAAGDVPVAGEVATPNEINPADNALRGKAVVRPQTSLRVTVSGRPDPYTAGLPVSFDVTVENGGPSDAKGVPVAVRLPQKMAGAKCVSEQGTPCGTVGRDGVLRFPADVPAQDARKFTVTGRTPSNSTDDITADATIAPPAGAVDERCEQVCSADATVEGRAETATSVTITHSPAEYEPGRPLTQTVTVSNAGPSDAQGTSVEYKLPDRFEKFRWRCEAFGTGSTCEQVSGQGDVVQKVNIAAGGKVVYTLSGNVPPRLVQGTVAVEPAKGVDDLTCARGCSAGDTVRVG